MRWLMNLMRSMKANNQITLINKRKKKIKMEGGLRPVKNSPQMNAKRKTTPI